MTTERVIDYREEQEIPASCPVCGAQIVMSEETGRVHIHGPADRQFANRYGIEGDGPVETLWRSWSCSSDPSHECGAPVLVASKPANPLETLRELAEASMVVGYTTIEGRVSEACADDLARRYQELGHAAVDALRHLERPKKRKKK